MFELFLTGWDPLYLIILAIGLVLSLGASFLVKAAFASARQVPTAGGRTGAEIAREILWARGIDDVQVVEHQGFLSDHYNPGNKTLALSPDVFHGRHAAAAGVAAHEVGHAIQHADGYFPMHIRSMLVLPANIGSMLGPILVMIGAGLAIASEAGQISGIAIAGVVIFAAATAFTLVTLPVEFDASARAKRIVREMGLIRDGAEYNAVSKVLTAAGLTYVAAAITAVLQLLYWMMRAGMLNNRD